MTNQSLYTPNKYLVIPAYEPDQRLVSLIKEAYDTKEFIVLVVDDGSGLAYSAIFNQVKAYAVVLQHPQNQGKGCALKTAYGYIKQQNDNTEKVIITADADGQHTIEDICAVGEECQKNLQALVLGKRSFTGKVPLKSRLGNLITRYVFRMESGQPVMDTQTGLRAFSTAELPFMLAVPGERYEYEMNVLLGWAKAGKKIEEIPIETIYLEGNKSSHFRPIQDACRIYRDLFRFGGVSFLSFLIDYSIYLILTDFLPLWPTLKIFVANTVARIVSGVFNFEMNRRFVFEKKDKILTSGLEYLCLAFCIYLLSTSGITFLYEAFHCNLYLLKIGVDAGLFGVSWLVQKYLIFRKKEVVAYEK